jgi:hypothetical protein
MARKQPVHWLDPPRLNIIINKFNKSEIPKDKDTKIGAIL